MIKGTGTDIIEIKRIEKACLNEEFIKKIYTENEIKEYIRRNKNISFLAGRFAAKEAVSKALGTGMRNISFKDIEILLDSYGKPYVNLKKDMGNIKIHISISHSKDNAVAFCIIEED